MVKNLLPKSIEQLRARYEDLYRHRPALLFVLERVLDAIKDVWGNQGTFKRTAGRLSAEMLPPLLDALDASPSTAEDAVNRVLQVWNRVAPTLDQP